MRKFVSGFVAGALIFSSITLFAAGGRTIEVFDAVKKIVVNKVDAPFDRNNKPFVYQGSTYVPLRFVADALGVKTQWDGQTGTVSIGETDSVQARHWDTDIKHSKYDGTYSNKSRYSHGKTDKYVTSNMGNRYSNYLSLETYSRYGQFTEITFPLNGEYSQFKGVLGCTDSFKNGDHGIKLTVLLDGREVMQKDIAVGMLELPIHLNTQGALNITFKVEGNEEKTDSRLEIGIFNGEFIK